MKKEVVENVEVKEVESEVIETSTEEVKETKKIGLPKIKFSKSWLKKAGIVLGGISALGVAYALGRGSKESYEDETDSLALNYDSDSNETEIQNEVVNEE